MSRWRILTWISLGCTTVDLAALLAHVLELPNKLALPGPLWLAVQQHLYRGRGAVLGPFEVGAIISTWVLVPLARGRRGFILRLIAAVLLTAMLGTFFALVQPVNVAFAVWTPQTLPARLPTAMGAGPRAPRAALRRRARRARPRRRRRGDSPAHSL